MPLYDIISLNISLEVIRILFILDQSQQSNRPQIIVSPRKVAAAVEAATASLLLNKRNIQQGTNGGTGLLLPAVNILNEQALQEPSAQPTAPGTYPARTGTKSVIVRAVSHFNLFLLKCNINIIYKFGDIKTLDRHFNFLMLLVQAHLETVN